MTLLPTFSTDELYDHYSSTQNMDEAIGRLSNKRLTEAQHKAMAAEVIRRHKAATEEKLLRHHWDMAHS